MIRFWMNSIGVISMIYGVYQVYNTEYSYDAYKRVYQVKDAKLNMMKQVS